MHFRMFYAFILSYLPAFFQSPQAEFPGRKYFAFFVKIVNSLEINSRIVYTMRQVWEHQRQEALR